MGESTTIKLSLLMALERKLDVIANNVANSNTTGFRAKRPVFQEFLSQPKEAEFSKKERPASLVNAGSSFTDTSRGAIQRTGNPLDVAINGEAYFVIETAQGERYTRNGSFTIGTDGRLVTGDGKAVLTENGILTVSLQDGEIAIGADGTISSKRGVLVSSLSMLISATF